MKYRMWMELENHLPDLTPEGDGEGNGDCDLQHRTLSVLSGWFDTIEELCENNELLCFLTEDDIASLYENLKHDEGTGESGGVYSNVNDGLLYLYYGPKVVDDPKIVFPGVKYIVITPYNVV